MIASFNALSRKLGYAAFSNGVSHPKFTLLVGVRKSYGDTASVVVPAAHDAAMNAFDDFFRSRTRVKSTKHVMMVGCDKGNRIYLPDKSYHSWRIRKLSLKEATAEYLVRGNKR